MATNTTQFFRPKININDVKDKKKWEEILDLISKEGIEKFNKNYKNFKLDKELISEFQNRKDNSKIRDLKSKFTRLQHLYEEVNNRYDDLLFAKSELQIGVIPEIKTNNGHKDEATAIICFSDWHVGEEVKKEHTFGLNEYNKNIVYDRVKALTNNTLKLIKKEKKDLKLNHILLHLGGDFIGGWIHPELSQTNIMSPIEEVLFAGELLTGCIETLLSKCDCALTIVCSRGNHARISPKMQFSNEMETSYETILYSILADKFKGRLKFYIEESGIGYVDVYQYKIRYYHGHQVRYLGGIGGLTIPLNKWLHRQDQTIKANYNLMGHYHSYSHPTMTTTLNGSLKGYDSYAINLGLPFEPPLQAFTLLDSRYGITGKFPIFCQ